MLSEELKSINASLGKILGRMDPEAAARLRICRRNLTEAIELADNLEKKLYPVEAE